MFSLDFHVAFDLCLEIKGKKERETIISRQAFIVPHQIASSIM
jgi:hypothetical protein